MGSEKLFQVTFLGQKAMRALRVSLFALMFGLMQWSTPPILAQSGAGTIQGTITDPSGGVISGAIVHVINTDTGVSTNTKSNDTGFFQVPELFTGSYRVTVTAPGMKTYITHINLQVEQSAVLNPVLTVGQVAEVVTVTGNAMQLVTEDNGTIEATLENERINQLPMNGRELFTTIQNTTPGLENSGQNVGGLGAEGLEYVADGVPLTNSQSGGEPNQNVQQVDPDAVQEVKIELNGAGAQYATPATGIITTKSGTNKIHGSLFETARNNAIGVARSRGTLPGKPPQLARNEFGISAGGPVIIPHFYDGRDKTFWFFGYERYSLAQGSLVQASVPTVAMRNGNYNGLTDGNGNPYIVYDPSTTMNNPQCQVIGLTTVTEANPYCRTQFDYNGVLNQINPAEESPLAKVLYDITPLPNNAANPYAQPNLTQYVPQFQVAPHETLRLDHVFNPNNRVYLRYNHNFTNIQITGGIRNVAADGIPAGAAEGYTNSPINMFFTALGYTHVFSSTFFAETILSQEWFNTTYDVGYQNQINYEKLLNLPNNFGEAGFPSITGIEDGFSSSQTSHEESQIITDLDENLTKIEGHHQIQFGGRIRHERIGDRPAGLADTVAFGGNPTAIYDPTSGSTYSNATNTGLGDASLFLGSVGSYGVTQEPPYVHYYLNEFDFYVQDNYHWTKNLTVNMGLRYEAHPGFHTSDGLANSFDLKNDAMVLGASPQQLIKKGYTTQAIITNDEYIGMKFETPQEAGMPASLMNSYNLNFLPRIGAAYVLPFSSTKYPMVVRGSFGMFDYVPGEENYANHPEQNNPFVASYSMSYSAANQAIDGLPNEYLRYDGPATFGVAGLNTQNVVNTNATNAILPGVTLFSTSPNWMPDHATEANFTIEQQFKGGSALRASYVYTRGTHLDIANYFNNPLSSFQWEMANGTVPPTGGASVIGTSSQDTYAATALGPYDQTTYGSNALHTKPGWSNDNSLQINYQRLYHSGSAYQISWVYSKSLRFGGDQQSGSGDTSSYPYADFPQAHSAVGTFTSADPDGTFYHGAAPPTPPSGAPTWQDYHAIDAFEGYQLDTAVPKLHVRFNGILDIPAGRGKRFLGHVNRFWDEVVGGFQIAGDGNVVSQTFNPNQGNWGAAGPIKLYKHHPILDCRGGNSDCIKALYWFNGYQSPKLYQGCTSACLVGMPTDYQPDQVPVNNDVGGQYFNTNDVIVHLTNGKTGVPGYDAGPIATDYLSKTFLPGPYNWTADISLFKVFPITKSVNFRVNVDAFNVFNMQGYGNPGTGGVIDLNSSANTPRQIQITARLNF
jgi:Carboxypeptidase regulatory-like domain